MFASTTKGRIVAALYELVWREKELIGRSKVV
jgi:hypothetical protein